MKAFTSLLVPALLLSGPALAQDTPRDLRDMVGARAGQAEGELQRRGYRNTGAREGDDRRYTAWWNDDRRQCVIIATTDGRYDSIVTTPAPDCGQRATSPAPDPRARERTRGTTAPDDLSRYCKGEASAAFDQRPSEITTNLPIRGRNGTIVQGWFDREKGTKFFSCRFDPDGRFLSVN